MRKKKRMMRKIIFTVIIFFLVIFTVIILLVLKNRKTKNTPSNVGNTIVVEIAETSAAEQNSYINEEVSSADNSIGYLNENVDDTNVLQNIEPQILKFVDVFGQEYETEINTNVPAQQYDVDKYVFDGEKLAYEDDKYYSRLGVDVSYHQGHIDWNKVKAAGFDFAIIRIGYRGYGKAGSINLDKQFEENIKNAQLAGLDVGVYFFAQAVNEDEAAEEAEFVINHLKGYDLQLPVVYDPESILDADARTDNVSGEQFTKNTIRFCSMIEEAGYKPMIYSNMLWEAFEFNMPDVCNYPFWYADYEKKPQTPYTYCMWQYSNTGNVPGIAGGTDLDIELIEK